MAHEIHHFIGGRLVAGQRARTSRVFNPATGEETGGTCFLAEICVAPGGGTPPHIHHREDESFQMLEGTLAIQVGGNTIIAGAGDFALLPPA